MSTATIGTDLGDITIELYDESAPKATRTSRSWPAKGFYDGVIFHRVIPGFVIQAGDGKFGKKASLDAGRVGTGGPGYTFEDEKVQGDYVRGALAMANAGPNTNGCAVLHLRRRPDRQAAQELHALRPGHEGHGRRRQDRLGALATARDLPERAGRDHLD